jgi:large subunit ribosomal protein L35
VNNVGNGKMKTRKAAARRFRMNKNGKVKRNQSGKRHLATGKSPSRKRRLRKNALVHSTNSDMMRRLLPYG